MPRETARKAGAAALETTLRAAMPGLEQILASIQADIRTGREEVRSEIRSLRDEMRTEIRTLDAKVDNLRQEMLDRFEAMLNTVNEVSHRVTRLDGKLEGYTEAMGLRLTMTDIAKPARKRRAV